MPIEEITQHERESGSEFLPRFDQSGLITAVVSDFETGQPLMVAHMNEQALRLTLSSGEAHFYSRSRAKIWHKGETSGNVLTVQEIRIDCDQDASLAFCHRARPRRRLSHRPKKLLFSQSD